MAWDYAELSKAAKAAGGPEALMDKISEDARQDGREEMIPVVFAVGVVGSIVGWGLPKLVKFFQVLLEKKNGSPKDIEEAKAEIIQGIKDYDAAHENEEQADTDSNDMQIEDNEEECEDGTV